MTLFCDILRVFAFSLNVASFLALLLNIAYVVGVVYMGVTVTRMDNLQRRVIEILKNKNKRMNVDTEHIKGSTNDVHLELTALNTSAGTAKPVYMN